MNNINNFNKNYIDFNNINNMKNINNSKFKRVNDQKSLPKKIPNENIQYNRIINNKRYESKREESIELMDKKINSTNNNMNYKLNKDYSYEPINKILFNKIITNKSVNKNEHSNRKNIINIPQNNFIRTSNFNKIPDINDLNKFKNEDGKISMNTFMKQMMQRNSLQSKSQSKKSHKGLKNMINSVSDNQVNNGINYIKNNNINNIQKYPFENQNEKMLMKTFQQNNASLLNPKLNNYQNRYKNMNIYTYQGKNDKINLINNNKYISNIPIEIPAF